MKFAFVAENRRHVYFSVLRKPSFKKRNLSDDGQYWCTVFLFLTTTGIRSIWTLTRRSITKTANAPFILAKSVFGILAHAPPLAGALYLRTRFVCLHFERAFRPEKNSLNIGRSFHDRVFGDTRIENITVSQPLIRRDFKS